MKWFSDYKINKDFTYKNLHGNFSMRSKDGFMGRFGGGWNWKLGFQVGGNTIIISLLVAELRFYWRKDQ